MSYRVSLTAEALADLQRLEDFLIDQALQHGHVDLPGRAMDAIEEEFRVLQRNPFTCRMAAQDPLERELVIPFGATGYVAGAEERSCQRWKQFQPNSSAARI